MYDSCFLCAQPSFVEGLARIFDFAGTLNEYNRSTAPAQADEVAIRNDWRLVGMDMQKAVAQVEASDRS